MTTTFDTHEDIRLSDEARERILALIQGKGISTDAAQLRISVVSGGCSGLSYQLDFEPIPPDEQLDPSDQIFERDGIRIVIGMRSFLYLAGTRLHFSAGLQGKGFHFENPNASRTCSCGESFSL